MDLEKYNKLKEEIDSKSFEKNYNIIDKILYFASFLGNAGSVVFAYFFLNTILINSTDEFPGRFWLLPLISIISLSTFELLKRFLFKKLALSWISNNKIIKETIVNFLLSTLIVSASFYLSISGANKFADKGKVISQNIETTINFHKDSLNNLYNERVNKLEEDKKQWIQLLTGTRSIKLRSEYNQSITQINSDIKNIESERSTKIKETEESIRKTFNKDIIETSSNQIAFILISTFIELLILIGVWFNVYFDFKILREYEETLLSNSQYHLYILHVKLLAILYNNGKLKSGNPVVSFAKLSDLIKLSGIRILQKDVKNFLIICNNLTILNTKGKTRFIEKTFEEAKEILRNHYNFH